MERFLGNLMTSFIYILLLMLIFYGKVAIQIKAQIPDYEVEALREVARSLNKTDWNFNEDPCSNDTNTSWVTPPSVDRPYFNNSVTCNCSFPDGKCHVVSIGLQQQNLTGVLPPAIAKLPHLTFLKLDGNYLSGNIPNEWASMKKLEFLALSANRLTGRIPSLLGKIVTLKVMSLDTNMFSGTVPPELGNLVDMEILLFCANNLTGTLPVSLKNLTKLTELRISSNNFIGKLPNYFQNWKNLQKLEIQASGFEGPIPSVIFAKNNFTELRISDLHGEGSGFPDLKRMIGMEKLMFRNCNISGSIPRYIATWTKLRILDLSFNRLEGDLSSLVLRLPKIENLYLTSNMLSGTIPSNEDPRAEVDLSYNNFSEKPLPPCSDRLNLFRSTSGGNHSKPAECLNNHVCSKDIYSLHINCGGVETEIGGITYEDDSKTGTAASFVASLTEDWAISNTGHFWDKTRSSSDYIAKNSSILKMKNPTLYSTARLSPLSLTYYIRCLANGNYSIKLHFAEIVIRANDSRTFYSLGRRIFDVYIQGDHVLKDFNIAEEAQGVDKPIIPEFKAVVVRDGTLEIRFYWAGKGTAAIPDRGTCGPLISAIDVESEFDPPNGSKRKRFIVSGTVILLFIFIVVGILWWKIRRGGRKLRENELVGLDLQTGMFSFRQIKAATNDFDRANKIGEGGFGPVYRGILSDGTAVAVKQLSSRSKQGNREFVTEIGMISALQHPNLVRLYGCCVEGSHLLLVYEYMENNSLAHALFGKGQLNLDWPIRHKICVGIARGLAFLHEESTIKIVHRDIKTTNVLLDGDLNPKISDFGLAKLDDEENSHISTRIAGTIGYMAPEYALWGHLTYKADVYSFGVVVLEIVAGKDNMKHGSNENFVCLLDWALVLQQKGNLMELVDPRLESKFDEEQILRVIEIALLCTNPSPALRPTMSAVVSMLEGRAKVDALVMDTSFSGDEFRFKAMKKQYKQILTEGSSSETETQSLVHVSSRSDPIWNGSSSTSTQDLYPLNPDSSFR